MSVEVGSVLEGRITGITEFGAFVDIGGGKTGLVHISEIADTYVKDIKEHLDMNETVKVKVISMKDDGKIALSIRRVRENQSEVSKKLFENRLSDFLKDSEQRQKDIKRSFEAKRDRGRNY